MRAPALCLLLAIACVSCAGPTTEVAIPDKPLPQAFASAANGPSAAQASWRQHFADDRLKTLIDEAVKNNQDLMVAMQRIAIARAGVQVATGMRLPQVALGAGAGLTKFGLYTMDGAGNASTDIEPGRVVPSPLSQFAVGLHASWEIDLWGRLRNLREAAVARYLAAIEGTKLVLTSLVADVATLYFELLAADQVLQILQQSVTKQEEAVEVVRLQKAAGRANELALLQFQSQLIQTRALEREASVHVAQTENMLNVLLGRYPRSVARSHDDLFSAGPQIPALGFPADLLRNRPDIREAELQVEASKYDLKAARAAFFPSINLSAGIGLAAFRPGLLLRLPESLEYGASAGLLAPLVNRTALQAQHAGAKASQLEAMYNYQKAILVGFVEVVNALSSVRNSDEILELRNRQQAMMEQTVEAASLLYRAGKANYLEVLIAQQNGLQANLDRIDAAKRGRLASVTLYKALGGGWR